MNVYAIEYVNAGGKLASTRYGAGTAAAALAEFGRDHPGAEVTELRKVAALKEDTVP